MHRICFVKALVPANVALHAVHSLGYNAEHEARRLACRLRLAVAASPSQGDDGVERQTFEANAGMTRT